MTAAVDKQSLDQFFIGIQSVSSLDTKTMGCPLSRSARYLRTVLRDRSSLLLILSEPSPRSS